MNEYLSVCPAVPGTESALTYVIIIVMAILTSTPISQKRNGCKNYTSNTYTQ